jgi:hypothetical protein
LEWMWSSATPNKRARKRARKLAQAVCCHSLFESIRCQDAQQEGAQSGTSCVGSTVPGARTASSQGTVMCHSKHNGAFQQKKARRKGVCSCLQQNQTKHPDSCYVTPSLPGVRRRGSRGSETTTTCESDTQGKRHSTGFFFVRGAQGKETLTFQDRAGRPECLVCRIKSTTSGLDPVSTPEQRLLGSSGFYRGRFWDGRSLRIFLLSSIRHFLFTT